MELFTYLMAKNDHNTSVNKDLFSYLLGKNQSGTYTDYSGTSLSINNTKKGKMKVNLLGNTSQTGTPTPSSPIDVNVVSGDNTIVSTGKNLLAYSIDTMKSANTAGTWSGNTYTYNGLTFTINEDLSVTIDGTSALGTSFYFSKTNFTLPAGDYCYSLKGRIREKNNFEWHCTNTSYNGYISLSSSSESFNKTYTESITINETLTYVKVGVTLSNVTIYPMLELGSTATTYEPYTSTSYPIHLGDKEICKIGNYEDKIFKAIKGNEIYDSLSSEEKNTLNYGKWYLRKAINKVVLDGSENWGKSGASTSSIFVGSTNITNAIDGNGLSNLFTYSSQVGAGYFTIYNNGANLRLCVDNNTISTIEAFKTWLSTHNTIVYYVLATPTYTQITGTLKDELEAVYNAQSYKGTTNINQINNDLPFNMDVSVKVGN